MPGTYLLILSIRLASVGGDDGAIKEFFPHELHQRHSSRSCGGPVGKLSGGQCSRSDGSSGTISCALQELIGLQRLVWFWDYLCGWVYRSEFIFKSWLVFKGSWGSGTTSVGGSTGKGPSSRASWSYIAVEVLGPPPVGGSTGKGPSSCAGRSSKAGGVSGFSWPKGMVAFWAMVGL